MRPITIRPDKMAREAGYLSACLFVALAANIFAVIKFHRPYTELFSQLGFVIVISIALYAYIIILRIIYHAIVYLFSKIQDRIKNRNIK